MAELLEVGYALDMDRCLLDTDAVMAHLSTVLESFGVDAEQTARERTRAMKEAGSIEVWSHLCDTILPQYNLDPELVKQQFLSTAPQSDLLYPGAAKALNQLSGRAFVLTYGGETWQQMKADLSGISHLAPLAIIDTPEKGTYIAENLVGDTYQIETNIGKVCARSLVLVDDKVNAFIGLPQDCRGYQIFGGDRLPQHEGALPGHVVQLQDFNDLLRLEAA